jgi:hypothetical protein
MCERKVMFLCDYKLQIGMNKEEWKVNDTSIASICDLLYILFSV